jgi:hypothetical protein
MHLNDNSLFCVLTSLDVMCSPNNLFMTDIMVSSSVDYFLHICMHMHIYIYTLYISDLNSVTMNAIRKRSTVNRNVFLYRKSTWKLL